MAQRKRLIYHLCMCLFTSAVFFESTARASTLQTYQRDKKVKAEPLTLEQALSKFRSQGPDYKTYKSELDAAAYTFRKAQYKYWMPSGNFSTSLSSESTVARYKGAYPFVEGNRDKFLGPTSISATLNLFQYTLFDGGLATLDFQKASLEQQKAIDLARLKVLMAERKLVDNYYSQRTYAEALDATFRAYQLWKTVEQLFSATSGGGTEAEADINEVKIQLNDTETKFAEYSSKFSEKSGALNLLMGEPPQKRFNLTSDLKISPLSLTPKDAMAQIELTSSQAIEKRHELRLLRIDAQVEIIQMGLKPRISFSGLEYKYSFGKNAAASVSNPTTVTAGDSESSNFTVKFDLSLEAPLFGEGGFFKHFDREEKQRNILEKERSVADLKQEWEQKVMTLVDAVKRLEDDTRRAEDSLRLIVKQLDRVLDRLSRGTKVSVRDLKDYVGGSLKLSTDALFKKQEVLTKRFEFDDLLGSDTTRLLGEERK